MNISGLIRNLVGELTASDSKTLELKVGQIVKGVVLQLLNDQEAVLNISGVQVRAKLETPLKQGDVTMLQVQPESNGGQVMLKPLASSNVQIADDSFSELLKDFAVKDTASNRQLVQTMQQAGVSLTKETVKDFASLLSVVPEGVSKDEFMQAAVLAYKKGLPLTEETVSALRQATAGPPVGEVLERLEQRASALLQEQPSHPAAATAKQVVTLLQELRASVAAAGLPQPPAGDPKVAPAAVTTPAGEAAGGVTAGSAQPPAAESAAARSAVAAEPAAARSAAAAEPAAARPAVAAEPAAARSAVAAEPVAARSAVAAGPLQAQALSAEPGRASEPPAAGSLQAPPAKPEAAATPAGASHAAPAEPADDPAPNWISKLLKAVGVEHEAHLAKLDQAERHEVMARLRNGGADPQQDLIGVNSSQDHDDKPAADNLKSLLLQLTASDDTPAPLREAAKEAIHQITGQQLMLTTDKTSMFTHMTLFIPFLNGSGQQSASVHIQSQKGKRGEVDASNCRLLFDLSMKAMGNTLLDVHVVNKIVSLNIHNDHPAVAALMESSRDELTAAMNKAGYQFFSLKCSPYPTLTAGNENDSTAKPAQLDSSRADLRALYQPKTYKGVDLRA
ncbi:serine/threonine-protein kinase [Paenibacillus aestuarii]|uniref:Flagellar hook-length control protein FliK n=1 Tax=Paenibacillus aestuarii TaxID=516965 RepID=A0ABW0K4L5_9BACL|nr:hypothetical protein [Paenibacillus aestuarii]